MSSVSTLNPDAFLSAINAALGSSHTCLPDAWFDFLQTQLSSGCCDVAQLEWEWLDSLTSLGAGSTEDQWEHYLAGLGYIGALPDKVAQFCADGFMSFGPELVTNGSFDADTNWTKGAGVTISGGTANLNSSATLCLYQNVGITFGKKYRLRLSVTSYTSGTLQVWPGGTSSATTQNVPTSTGSYTIILDLTAEGAANGNLIFGHLTVPDTAVMSIDNISLKEIL